MRAGEIVGIAGVAGNGQSELLEAVSGMRDQPSGAVRLKGQPLSLEGDDGAHRAPRGRAGACAGRPAAHGPGHGVPGMGERHPRLSGRARSTASGLLLDIDAAHAPMPASRCKTFDVRPGQPSGCKTANFSGGNQQKIVLAREIERDPDVLMVGQPTRGVDIGAIEFIHNQIIEMRDAGKAILLVSVELDEIRSLVGPHPGDVRRAASSARPTLPPQREGELGLMMAGCPDAREPPNEAVAALGRHRPAAADQPGRWPSWSPAWSCSRSGENPIAALEAIWSLAPSARLTTSATRSTTPPTSSSPGLRSRSPPMPGCSTSAAMARPISPGSGVIAGRAAAAVPAVVGDLPDRDPRRCAVGGFWAFIPGWLQAKRGSHVVITTIMFNFIAAAIMVYMVVNVLKPPAIWRPESAMIAAEGRMPKLGDVHPVVQEYGRQLHAAAGAAVPGRRLLPDLAHPLRLRHAHARATIRRRRATPG